MTAREVGKYAAHFRLARRRARRQSAELYGRVIFFGAILFVFSALWKASFESLTNLRAHAGELVWYLAVTEWIVISVPPVFTHIAEEVRRGDVVYRVARPTSYVIAAFSEGIGELSARMPLLAGAGAAFAFAMTGWVPDAALLLLVVPFGVFAALLLLAIYVIIGLSAFWLGEVSPVYWVTQKLLFVLGGLMLPLEVYPPELARAAAFTPFPSILHGPASLLLQSGTSTPGHLAVSLGAWLTVVGAASRLLFERARRARACVGG